MCIRDRDYTQIAPVTTFHEVDDALTVRLPCKELENLVVLDSQAIAEAARIETERRRVFVPNQPDAPTQVEIARQIDVLSRSEPLRETLHARWKERFLAQNPNEENVDDEFDNRWQNADWRKRCVGGV